MVGLSCKFGNKHLGNNGQDFVTNGTFFKLGKLQRSVI